MKLSLIVATNRPAYWPHYFNSLVDVKTELEVIVVTPCADRPALPVPATFIISAAKPTMCWEMGSRIATGDLLALGADDMTYQSGFIDAVAATAPNMGSVYDMITARYFRNGVDQLPYQRMLSIPSMPLLPVGGFVRTDIYRQLGGIDSRFNAVLWDADLYMRCYEAGGRTTMLTDYIFHEDNPDIHNHLFANNNVHDRAVLESLWFRRGIPGMKRLSPVQSFDDGEIRTNISDIYRID